MYVVLLCSLLSIKNHLEFLIWISGIEFRAKLQQLSKLIRLELRRSNKWWQMTSPKIQQSWFCFVLLLKTPAHLCHCLYAVRSDISLILNETPLICNRTVNQCRPETNGLFFFFNESLVNISEVVSLIVLNMTMFLRDTCLHSLWLKIILALANYANMGQAIAWAFITF